MKISKSQKPKRNPLAIVYSLLALAFMPFVYLLHWTFIIPAAVFCWLSWRELFKK